MASWTAIYVNGELPVLERVPIEGKAEVRTLGKWTEIVPAGFQDPEALALAISAQTKVDVLSVQIQTTASVVGVTHLSSAQVVRRVEHADGGWQRVEGTPQEWERELFNARALEDALDDGGDEAAIRAAFAAGRLSSGARLPVPDEFGTMCLALGVTRADWTMLRNQPAMRVLQGSKRTMGPLVLLSSTIACVIGAIVVGRGDARALFASAVAMLLFLTMGAGLMRKLRVGKWFL